jgi:hypothetical protein
VVDVADATPVTPRRQISGLRTLAERTRNTGSVGKTASDGNAFSGITANHFNSPTGQELTQTAIETVSGTPTPMSVSPRSAIAREINIALESGSVSARLEAQVARTLWGDLVSFRKQVFNNAGKRIGEIDVELKNAIVEVTSDQTGKAGQAAKLVADKVMNPLGKPVIVYGPNLTRKAGQAVEAARTPEELKKVLGGL